MREENPEDTRLEKYLQMFRNLQTDRGWDRYPEITYYRAPHNPFLLLSIIDLIAQGRITENLIEPSYELVDTFKRVRQLHGPVLVHVVTSKGKGYAPAMKHPERFHGTGPFNVETGTPASTSAARS